MTLRKYCLTAIMTLIATVAHAELTSFEVFPAYAPHPNGVGWSNWVNNAHSGIDAGGAPVGGDRNLDPSAYEPVVGSTRPHELIVTNFKSWRGKAVPSPFYSFAVSGEFGNRIHFGTQISSEFATPFSLQDVSYELDSDDDDDHFDKTGNFATADYSPTRIGINFGTDMALGGGDDIVYDNGEDGGLPVHQLSYVGVGTAFDGTDFGDVTGQAVIDDVLRSILGGCGKPECEVTLTGRYKIDSSVFGREVIRSADVTIDIPAGFGGDFNLDGYLDVLDIDALTHETAIGSIDILYDVTADGNVDYDDIDMWVNELRHTYFGDANVDGQFDTKDLIKMFQAAKYETGEMATWSEGDFNGDGFANSSDLVLAFIQNGYEKGQRWVEPAGAQAVPEPASVALLLVGLATAAGVCRRRPE
ncbi:PEP-CTERM sorting domain-containing protein [Planctomycetota bacterium]